MRFSKTIVDEQQLRWVEGILKIKGRDQFRIKGQCCSENGITVVKVTVDSKGGDGQQFKNRA